MKHRVISALLAVAMCFSASAAVQALGVSVTETAVLSGQTAQASYDETSVYNAIIALQDEYPDGMEWTNENYYEWNGGYYNGGYGCVAFAFILSDAAFGDLPSRMITVFDASSVRVGDILRYSGHSFIVLEVKENSVIAAEGNINSSIMWGREISFDEIAETFEEHITRYPLEETTDLGDVDLNGIINASDAGELLVAAAAIGAGNDSGLNAEQTANADVDGNGTMDATDAAWILSYAAYLGTGGGGTLQEYYEMNSLWS